MIRGVSPAVWALRGAVVLGAVVAISAAAPQGHAPSAFMLALVIAAALGWAFAPDYLFGGVALLLVIVWWAIAVGDALPVSSVVAATGLLLSHTAATVLGYGPPRTRLAPRLVASWALRAAAVWPSALAIWLLAHVYTGHPTPTSFWLLGLAAALVGAVVAAFVVPVRHSRRP